MEKRYREIMYLEILYLEINSPGFNPWIYGSRMKR